MRSHGFNRASVSAVNGVVRDVRLKFTVSLSTNAMRPGKYAAQKSEGRAIS